MSATVVRVKGMDEFQAALEANKGAERIFAMFCGGKDESGNSWCPDCVQAEPVVMSVVEKETTDADAFIYVDVGDRATWKPKDNPFRVHSDLRLTGVPTLLQIGSPKKLVESECFNAEVVAMLFED
eukprot:m.6015 g.6015  ORF g.6015 m.6015 type:complete len:126 (+) comp5117_c0_seq1:211-588(+)